MARKRKGREVSGWICLDKAVGQTSTAMVGSVKRLFGAAKAGHAGTLDPLASGALPIALGEATKTVPFVQDSRKVYRFTIRWGIETDTDDTEGKTAATSECRPDRGAIEALLPDFTGEIMQVPPAFSAIKVEGERAYDLARGGQAPELEARPVAIYRLELIGIPDPDTAVLEAECGKGTYVRALARDMGRRLGTFGHIAALRRASVGPFDETTMIPLETLITAREEGTAEALDRFLLPVGVALRDLPEIAFFGADAARIRRGQPVIIRGRDAPKGTGVFHATCAGETIAVGEVERGEFHPKRVFTPA